MNDKEIVGMFIERDEKAISESHGKYGNYLNYISYNVVYDKQDAEECVNDALLAAWNSIPPHKPENLKTYLGKLAKRIAVSRLRQNRASKRLPTEYAVSLDEIAEIAVDEDFDASITDEELSARISSFLRSLPESERNIFIRRYWYGDSIDNICERYGFGASKIKMTLKRTRDKLANILKKEGYMK